MKDCNGLAIVGRWDRGRRRVCNVAYAEWELELHSGGVVLVRRNVVEGLVFLLGKVNASALQAGNVWRKREDDRRAFLLVPAHIVIARLRICDHWVFTRAVNTTHLGRGFDGRLAQRVLRILDEDLVKVGVVDVVQANESSEDVRGEVLQDVKLVTC